MVNADAKDMAEDYSQLQDQELQETPVYNCEDTSQKKMI